MLLAASLPATAVLAQTQTQPGASQPQAKSAQERQRPRLSPEARAQLLDGRMAMIRESLKLNDAQSRLWAPVEAQLRADAAERAKLREERRQQRGQGATAPSLSLPDRLDRASQRMTQRAERLKAFNAVFKPFYASLSDEQKVLSRIVLREARGGGMHRRWAQHRAPGSQQQ
jgi:hypothetical protein